VAALGPYGTTRLPHDPDVANVLAQGNYRIEAAIAEIIDNSIDAGARHVLVRLLRDNDIPSAIQIVDDGSGIPESRFDDAMTMALHPRHERTAIGLYGVGLKSASLAIAKELTVVSKTTHRAAVARGRSREDVSREELRTYDSSSARAYFASVGSQLPWNRSECGTIVLWEEIDDFLRLRGAPETAIEYGDRLLARLTCELGLIFHRFIERRHRGLKIFLDVQDQLGDTCYLRQEVQPINPFAYPKSGHVDYPKTLVATTSSGFTFPLAAHIWPKGMKCPEYNIPREGIGQRKLRKMSADESQGFYVYYKNRLLVAGGWRNLRNAEAHDGLARVILNVDEDAIEAGIVVTFDKTDVKIPETVATAILRSRARDGTTWEGWIRDANAANRRAKRRRAVLPIPRLTAGSGLPSRVVRTLEALPDSGARTRMRIEWSRLEPNRVFRVDADSTIRVNSRYQEAILRRSGPDASRFLSISAVVLLAGWLAELGGARKARRLDAAIQAVLLASITGGRK
jgi:hypothetical protein